MSKKKSVKKSADRPMPSRRLMASLQEADDLLASGQPMEALGLLKELDAKYPDHPDVLVDLVNLYSRLGDSRSCEGVLRHLRCVEPDDPEIVRNLAATYMRNAHLMLSLQTFREFLQRWPHNAHAAEAQEGIRLLEVELHKEAEKVALPDDQAFELLLLHDESRFCMDRGDLRKARKIIEKLLDRFPNFVSAWNNLSQICGVLGESEKAAAATQRALELDPTNIHALANRAAQLFLIGHPEEAAACVAHLKEYAGGVTDRWPKIAETLSLLGDDEGVLELYSKAEAAGELELPFTDAMFYHFLAAATCRLGDETRARRYWEKALALNANLAWAQENLADLDRPKDDRSGPWALPYENWRLGSFLAELSKLSFKSPHRVDDKRVQATISRFIEEKHPEVLLLAPHLIDRSGPDGRMFVVHLAIASHHPQLVELVRSFALGKRGTFEERMNVAQLLNQADLLPSGMVRLWRNGAWEDSLLLNMEISSEPVRSERLPKAVESLHVEGMEALRAQDGAQALPLMQKAVALLPDNPHLLNNLAIAYQMQGELERARQLFREIHERFPDYFLGTVTAARLAMGEGELEQARDLLAGLMHREKLHISEFQGLCAAQIELLMKEGQPEAARSWLGMWGETDPYNPGVSAYRRWVESGEGAPPSLPLFP